jgi:hypothetical protein
MSIIGSGSGASSTIFPIWQTVSASAAGGRFDHSAASYGSVIWRGRKEAAVDMEAVEYAGTGLERTALRKPIDFEPFRRLFGIGQVGPVYLGISGTISVVFGGLASLIIIQGYLHQVAYNPIMFLREFFVLSVNPPAVEYGLGFISSVDGNILNWYEGGNWIFATFLLHIAVVAWWLRVRNRAEAAGLRPSLANAFLTAMFLYFIIYLIRPVIMGNWAQAPGQGFKSDPRLDKHRFHPNRKLLLQPVPYDVHLLPPRFHAAAGDAWSDHRRYLQVRLASGNRRDDGRRNRHPPVPALLEMDHGPLMLIQKPFMIGVGGLRS